MGFYNFTLIFDRHSSFSYLKFYANFFIFCNSSSFISFILFYFLSLSFPYDGFILPFLYVLFVNSTRLFGKEFLQFFLSYFSFLFQQKHVTYLFTIYTHFFYFSRKIFSYFLHFLVLTFAFLEYICYNGIYTKEISERMQTLC